MNSITVSDKALVMPSGRTAVVRKTKTGVIITLDKWVYWVYNGMHRATNAFWNDKEGRQIVDIVLGMEEYKCLTN